MPKVSPSIMIGFHRSSGKTRRPRRESNPQPTRVSRMVNIHFWRFLGTAKSADISGCLWSGHRGKVAGWVATSLFTIRCCLAQRAASQGVTMDNRLWIRESSMPWIENHGMHFYMPCMTFLSMAVTKSGHSPAGGNSGKYLLASPGPRPQSRLFWDTIGWNN